MNFRKILALVIMVSLLLSSSSFAAPKGDSETLSAYESLLSTPQGRELLRKANTGQEITIGNEEIVETNLVEKQGLTNIEKQFSAVASLEGLPEIRLFGYDAFKKSAVSFVPDSESPVPSNYLIGAGDSFNITLWGISEGIFKVTVNQEGEITLPKVGVVSVAGLRYGDLKAHIEEHLGRYYEQINVNITMAEIKTIRVYVVGEVEQPGSYTVSSLSTLYSTLFQAGGPSKHGTMRNIKLVRDGKTIATVDLYKFLLYGDKSHDQELVSGDTIFVPSRGSVVGITGNVERPAIYEIKGKAEFSDILSIAGGFTPVSYLNRIQIERIVAHQRKIVVDENVASQKARTKIALQDMDLVKIYPIFSEIQNVVYVEGNFKQIGPYEWKPGMMLRDIITSKALLKPYSYLPKAEVVRLDKETLATEVFEIDLEKLFAGDIEQNIALEFGDRIVVSTDFRPQAKVVLKGEVLLPGTYIARNDERLSSVIERAGGFTKNAYLFGAVFTRTSARETQETALSRFIVELEKRIIEQESRLAASGMSGERVVQQQEALEKSSELLDKLKASVLIKGRVILALEELPKFKDSKDNIVLEDGDELTVPSRPNIVSVLGEVYSPSSVIYQKGKKASFYLNKVGGITKNADNGGVYVVQADGSVLSGGNAFGNEVKPGDVIFVPQILERFDFFGSVGDFTRWFYEAAMAFAVIATYLKQ
ncbi:MAG: SLBB domain-containing protein [Candidatus Margulisbacteria bacterium]|nr:SLBB domain-containing protein [Candidatus Margulisiibacteriota bacterium]MBU1021506.1 SLBB domain-containing protein [Candidatus Margulisiibacteriota bacterium]MBU1728591.1 SLBB domain-containing protein [Candidatus Margulisiibacteriota bacterium]MBU1955830.1 SLBB domain-containing protein [Candidatus Margulisiibacteriota bacterium]